MFSHIFLQYCQNCNKKTGNKEAGNKEAAGNNCDLYIVGCDVNKIPQKCCKVSRILNMYLPRYIVSSQNDYYGIAQKYIKNAVVLEDYMGQKNIYYLVGKK
jgi:hypothetical protein